MTTFALLKETTMRVISEWPGGYRKGDIAEYNGRKVRVVSAPPGDIPCGQVPVMYIDDGSRYFPVPIDDLGRLPKRP